ncbi:MAG: 4Fe-4S dicluster domain-containing protein [Burkholderiaceae bacterium]|nr:4Fe-4S dicluster domain-containing protein [Burkholderiaceae bacterium]
MIPVFIFGIPVSYWSNSLNKVKRYEHTCWKCRYYQSHWRQQATDDNEPLYKNQKKEAAVSRFIAAEPKRCGGCGICARACSRAHKAAGLQSHPRLAVIRDRSLSAPVLCHHCEAAPCAKVCPVNAISQSDGAVVLDEVMCIGCKLCAIACPFGAITLSGTGLRGVASPSYHLEYVDPSDKRTVDLDPILDWGKGVRRVAVKCDLCDFHDSGPECVRACPRKALFLVDSDALLHSRAAKW